MYVPPVGWPAASMAVQALGSFHTCHWATRGPKWAARTPAALSAKALMYRLSPPPPVVSALLAVYCAWPPFQDSGERSPITCRPEARALSTTSS